MSGSQVREIKNMRKISLFIAMSLDGYKFQKQIDYF